jgi:hypothetical protein
MNQLINELTIELISVKIDRSMFIAVDSNRKLKFQKVVKPKLKLKLNNIQSKEKKRKSHSQSTINHHPITNALNLTDPLIIPNPFQPRL